MGSATWDPTFAIPSTQCQAWGKHTRLCIVALVPNYFPDILLPFLIRTYPSRPSAQSFLAPFQVWPLWLPAAVCC